VAAVILFGLLLASAPATPIAVQLRSASQNKTTERFASSVIKEFRSDRRFVVVAANSPAEVIVTLPNDVGYERSLDWTRISYQARIEAVGGASRDIHGSCWNWNLRVCAQQITAAAAAQR